MKDSLDVNVLDKFVGKLTYEKDSYIFNYDDEASEFISLTMTIRTKQYLNNQFKT